MRELGKVELSCAMFSFLPLFLHFDWPDAARIHEAIRNLPEVVKNLSQTLLDGQGLTRLAVLRIAERIFVWNVVVLEDCFQ